MCKMWIIKNWNRLLLITAMVLILWIHHAHKHSLNDYNMNARNVRVVRKTSFLVKMRKGEKGKNREGKKRKKLRKARVLSSGERGAIGNWRLTQGHIATFELGEDGGTSNISKKSAGRTQSTNLSSDMKNYIGGQNGGCFQKHF